MKRLIWLLGCLLMMAVGVCAAEELTIVHVTDMHYLSPELTDYSDAFMEVIENADGKVTHYTSQLMQAFVDEMLSLRPDAVILSGDLTFSGAAQSHKDLAALLQTLKTAGIQVLSLPGNHDTNSTGYRFVGGEVYLADSLEDADFDNVYLSLGYAGAAARDTASMSYLAEISDQVWCLLVDTNANGTAGTVLEETFTWIESQLLRAQRQGATVIAVSHQPVLIHNPLFTFGYAVNNAERLQQLYAQYGVKVNLCGHLHMQHVARAGDLTEIAASALAVAPNQYGVLHVRDGRLTDYVMQATDVAAWAEKTNQTDENLRNFAAYSQDFFDQTTVRQLERLFTGSAIDAETQAQMTEFAVRLNREYFSGTRKTTADDPAWQLWQEHAGGTFFTYYMGSILREEAQKMTAVSFDE